MSLLRAEDVTRRFGDFTALDSLSLALNEGETVGLIGPSGGGKTTAVRLLAGLDSPTVGTATVFGRPAGSLRRADRQRLSLLAQDPALVDEFSIVEHVRFMARMRRVQKDAVDDALERVGLAERRNTRLAEASGGMKRRTGLAAALVADPDLVFCDEPTAGLDPILRERVWEWFGERRSRGKAMLVTTQHIAEAARCDRVVVLRSGCVIFDAPPSELSKTAGVDQFIDIGVDISQQDALLVWLAGRGLRASNRHESGITLSVPNAAELLAELTAELALTGIEVLSVETREPDLDAVFRHLVEGQ